eukprot:g25567.t1
METPLKYLLLFTGFSACAQFDSGALAAFERFLAKDMRLTTEERFVVEAGRSRGWAEYVMLPLASPLIPWFLRCCKVKTVLLVCLVGNMLGVLLLTFAPMLQEKDPKDADYGCYWGDWVPVFLLNCLWFLATGVGIALTPAAFMSDSRGRSSSEPRLSMLDAPSGAGSPTSRDESRVSLRRSSVETEESVMLFASMALCVSSLFFVSGGLQFWAMPYMEQLRLREAMTCSVEEANGVHSLVVTLVGATTLTAPTFGVFVGSQLVDRVGGYKKAARSTAKLLAGGAGLAMLFGLVACFCPNFWLAVAAFWVFNMLGAALMPGAFGLMLGAVHGHRRPLASALAQLPINLLGMAGGAFVPGWIAGCEPPETSQPCNQGCDYAVGLRTLLFGPAFGIVLSCGLAMEEVEACRGVPLRSLGQNRGGMERRLPLTRDLLREFIFALPPLGASHRVCDLGCGTGRSAAALQAAYPMARLTLVDPDEGRLSLARRKLSEAGFGAETFPCSERW